MIEGTWEVREPSYSLFNDTSRSVLLGYLTISKDNYLFKKTDHHEISDHYRKFSFIQEEKGKIHFTPRTSDDPGIIGRIRFISNADQALDSSGYLVNFDEGSGKLYLKPDFHVHLSNSPPEIIKYLSK